MQSLMGETPKTALHRYSLLPTPCSLFPVPCSLCYECLPITNQLSVLLSYPESL
ncbi:MULTISPECIES: hypothetical protein [unclassified Moorena]|uniref:hypothetical protein n=1 Tax=unclassified Moorena TaxID=2683338 RepID=UPI001401404F|nr:MULTISPECIES: hypothetical protein [unclassified Moorena]NEO16044.1 hypothetical protein [Moorena sp. SIO3E8]NEP98231.1 hypothetical protein [Moorena sp. SIO3F7]